MTLNVMFFPLKRCCVLIAICIIDDCSNETFFEIELNYKFVVNLSYRLVKYTDLKL